MTNLSYSNIKSLRSQVENIGVDDWKEVVCQLAEGNEDFEVENFRFIHSDAIDKIQCDELSSDTYILGCFNAWFLADILPVPIAAIEALQKAEAYEALGQMILDMGKLEELQSEYASVDGYGHHFAGYDGYEHEIWVNGELIFAFRIN